MTIPVTVEQVHNLAPHAKDVYLQAFSKADEVLGRYGINKNAHRVTAFMAQIAHECGGFTILVENLNYTSPERLMKVWPRRFPTLASAERYVRKPEVLANVVYGFREDLGNLQSGDGWKFIGRGMLQITGRDSYVRIGKRLGIDLVGNPDLAFHPDYSLAIAASEWSEKGCNALADADQFVAVTRRINGGLTGLEERQEWLKKTREVWP